MNSALWIPCHNEGDQEVVYFCPDTNQTIRTTRHTVYETLRLLGPKIQSGVFGQVIITDDGSTDNTLEGIERFRYENDISERVLTVLQSNERVGKMGRFFQIMERCIDTGIDILAMTDADMITCGGNTFEKLVQPVSSFSGAMLVSHQAEYNVLTGKNYKRTHEYDVSGKGCSGTRSIVLSRSRAIFDENGIHATDFPGKGYGLEEFLNHYLTSYTYVNENSGGFSEVPHFLKPFRKPIRQGAEVAITRSAIKIRKPLTINVDSEEHALVFSCIPDGIAFTIRYADGRKRTKQVSPLPIDFKEHGRRFPLTNIVITVLQKCDPFAGFRDGSLAGLFADKATETPAWELRRDLIDQTSSYLKDFCVAHYFNGIDKIPKQ